MGVNMFKKLIVSSDEFEHSDCKNFTNSFEWLLCTIYKIMNSSNNISLNIKFKVYKHRFENTIYVNMEVNDREYVAQIQYSEISSVYYIRSLIIREVLNIIYMNMNENDRKIFIRELALKLSRLTLYNLRSVRDLLTGLSSTESLIKTFNAYAIVLSIIYRLYPQTTNYEYHYSDVNGVELISEEHNINILLVTTNTFRIKHNMGKKFTRTIKNFIDTDLHDLNVKVKFFNVGNKKRKLPRKNTKVNDSVRNNIRRIELI